MLGRDIFDVDHPTRKVNIYIYLSSNLVMEYMFSNKRNITEAFPSSSRRATNADWKLFDIRDDDGSEALSACPGPQDEYEIREVPEKFGESKGCKQNRELEEKDEASGGYIKEQENEREHDEYQESQEDKTLDQSELPGREQAEEREQAPVGHEESPEDKTLDQSELPGREQVEEQEREPVESEESQEDKTLDQDEVPEQEQAEEQEQEPVGHEESQEDKMFDRDEVPEREQEKDKEPKRSLDCSSRLSSSWLGDLSSCDSPCQPTPVDIPPKPDTHEIKGKLSGKMLKESEDIMKVEDPRDSDVVIL